MKTHKIIFFNKVEEKKVTQEEFIPLLSLKKKNVGVCIAFIIFMINLTNLELNYQHLSLSLSWTC